MLFTDLRSFTALSERIGPQATVQLLNEYFGLLADIVLDQGGVLDKYIGDAIMAAFGVPVARDGMASRSSNRDSPAPLRHDVRDTSGPSFLADS